MYCRRYRCKINTNLLDEEKIKFLFGEDQSRYLVEINQKNLQSLIEMAKNQEITLMQIGITQNDYLEIDEMNISVKELTEINNNWFANYNSK